MRGEDLQVIFKRGDPSHCSELGARQLVRMLSPKQVRPPGAAHDQAAAAEDGEGKWPVTFEHEIGEVLARVTRGLEGDDPQVADSNLVALAKSPMVKPILA